VNNEFVDRWPILGQFVVDSVRLEFDLFNLLGDISEHFQQVVHVLEFGRESSPDGVVGTGHAFDTIYLHKYNMNYWTKLHENPNYRQISRRAVLWGPKIPPRQDRVSGNSGKTRKSNQRRPETPCWGAGTIRTADLPNLNMWLIDMYYIYLSKPTVFRVTLCKSRQRLGHAIFRLQHQVSETTPQTVDQVLVLRIHAPLMSIREGLDRLWLNQPTKLRIVCIQIRNSNCMNFEKRVKPTKHLGYSSKSPTQAGTNTTPRNLLKLLPSRAYGSRPDNSPDHERADLLLHS